MAASTDKIVAGEIDDDSGMSMFQLCKPTPGVPMSERCCADINMKVCTPELPCIKTPTAPKFFGKDAKMSFFAATLMGAQHALGMTGGIITTPKLVAGDACFSWQKDQEFCDVQPYLICATLLASGLLTIVQVLRFKLCGGYYLGTGLISVMGPSFAFLPIAREVVINGIRDGEPAKVAYGRFLGTCMVASLLEIGLALFPPRIIAKIFPPIVCGTAVTLIGAALTGAGIKYWGGGVFCGENDLTRLANGLRIGNNFQTNPQTCASDNGEVDLPYGSPEFVGMGFLTVTMLVFIEIIGAPFWKNCSVVIALLITYFISMGMSYTAPDGTAQKYVTFHFTKQSIEKMPIAFFWIHTFPYGFEPAAILPLITAFFVSSAETVGDIGATCDASDIPAIGPDADTRVQGGLLSDGVNSFLAALFTTSPNTTYSQNSGVIAITRCASRSAGLACAFWLIALGLIGPLGGFCSDIPSCVLGGMVTFLFANVMVSGIQIISGIGVGRRNRIILSFALGIGLGVGMQPNFIDGGGGKAFIASLYQMNIGFYPKKLACVPGTEVMTTMGNPDGPGPTLTWVASCTFDAGKVGLRNAVVLFLKTPYCIGTVTALILNLILPMDELEKEAAAKLKGSKPATESASA